VTKPDADEDNPENEPDPEAPPPTPAPLIMKELATGKRIDVTKHPHIQMLPTIQECGFSAKEDTSNGKGGGVKMLSGRSTGTGKFPWMVRIVNEGQKPFEYPHIRQITRDPSSYEMICYKISRA